jgi:hypothetical protein
MLTILINSSFGVQPYIQILRKLSLIIMNKGIKKQLSTTLLKEQIKIFSSVF